MFNHTFPIDGSIDRLRTFFLLPTRRKKSLVSVYINRNRIYPIFVPLWHISFVYLLVVQGYRRVLLEIQIPICLSLDCPLISQPLLDLFHSLRKLLLPLYTSKSGHLSRRILLILNSSPLEARSESIYWVDGRNSELVMLCSSGPLMLILHFALIHVVRYRSGRQFLILSQMLIYHFRRLIQIDFLHRTSRADSILIQIYGLFSRCLLMMLRLGHARS